MTAEVFHRSVPKLHMSLLSQLSFAVSPSPTAFISQTNNPTLPALHMLFSDHFYLVGALAPCAPSVPGHTLVQLPVLENWGRDKIHRTCEQRGSRGHMILTERTDSRHMGIGSALHGASLFCCGKGQMNIPTTTWKKSKTKVKYYNTYTRITDQTEPNGCHQ